MIRSWSLSLGCSNEFKLYSSCFCALDDFDRVTARFKIVQMCVHKNFNSSPIYSGGWSVWIESVAVSEKPAGDRTLPSHGILTKSSNLCTIPILWEKIRPYQVMVRTIVLTSLSLRIRLILQLLGCQRMMNSNHC